MIELWQGDCLRLLDDVADGSVALILSDLPYGATHNAWDTPLPLDRLWEAFRRVLRPDGAVALCCMEPFTSDLVVSNRAWWRYNWCWYNQQSSGHLNSHHRPLRVVEQVAVFAPAEPRYYPQMQPGAAYFKATNGAYQPNYGPQQRVATANAGLRWPIDLLYFPVEALPGAPNPTRKPLALCRYLIRTYTRLDDLVLDPCMGTGTTGAGAAAEARRYIGIEQDPAQFTFAADRIGARSVLDGR